VACCRWVWNLFVFPVWGSCLPLSVILLPFDSSSAYTSSSSSQAIFLPMLTSAMKPCETRPKLLIDYFFNSYFGCDDDAVVAPGLLSVLHSSSRSSSFHVVALFVAVFVVVVSVVCSCSRLLLLLRVVVVVVVVVVVLLCCCGVTLLFFSRCDFIVTMLLYCYDC